MDLDEQIMAKKTDIRDSLDLNECGKTNSWTSGIVELKVWFFLKKCILRIVGDALFEVAKVGKKEKNVLKVPLFKKDPCSKPS